MSAYLQEQYKVLRGEIGKEYTMKLGTIAARDLHRFAVASHAPESWSDQGCPEGDTVAPPLFLSSVMGWAAGPPESDLDTDGTSVEETRGLPLAGVRLMGAGQDLEFHAPVRAGACVHAHTSLEDVQLKHGRSGTLLILRVLRRFTEADGEALVTCRESFVAR